MADNSEVLQSIKRSKGITYTALTPNLKGFKDAVSERTTILLLRSTGSGCPGDTRIFIFVVCLFSILHYQLVLMKVKFR